MTSARSTSSASPESLELSRFVSQHCWILHRRPWRESSLLLELFSLEHGRVGLVARGLRAERSPWRGLGEPFQPLEAGWTRRGELGSLTALEAAGARVGLIGRALWCGLYANELILSLIGRDEPVPALLAAYAELLERLPDDRQQGDALRRFELALLDGLGVAPDFALAAGHGEPIHPDGHYRLEPESGFVPVSASGRGVYSGRAILELAGVGASDADCRRQGRDITRTLIDHQLGGRILKTRELFRSIR